MTMSNADIVANYRQAKTPSKQIGILADMNECSRQEIVEILKSAGVELPGFYGAKKAAKAAPAAEPKPKKQTQGLTVKEWSDAQRALGLIYGIADGAGEKRRAQIQGACGKICEVLEKLQPDFSRGGGRDLSCCRSLFRLMLRRC